MRKLLYFFLPLALIFLTALTSTAHALAPDLQTALESHGPDEEIPVIITLSDKVDFKILKSLHKSLRRSRMITELKSRADISQRPLKAFLEGKGAKKLKPLWIINGIAVTVSADVIQELAGQPGIEDIKLDTTVYVPQVNYGTSSLPEWNLDMIRAPEIWNLGYRGAGVVVASMDTGVDLNHPDLLERWRGGGNSWYDPNDEHETPYDIEGHGTQTMGVIVGGDAGGTSIGVTPDAKWIAVKIFNDSGKASLSTIHQGFQWLLDPDGNPDTDDAPDIVNNSWGLNNVNTCSSEFQPDIQALKAADIAVVFAAGNSGPYTSTSVSPANNPEAFAVGAVGSSLWIAPFSSRGPSTCDGDIYPKVVAPGVNIRTSDLSSHYSTVSGTSFSSPHVAGAMALLRSAFPDMDISVSKMELALRRSAVDLGPEGPDNVYGYGLLDVSAAYSLLLDHGVTNPYLEVIKTGKGEGTVVSDIGSILCGADCFDSYDPGTVTLSVLPAGGSYFGGWSGCTSVNSDNQCIVSVNDDITVNAQFLGNLIQVMKPVEGEVVPSGSRTTVTWVAPSNVDHFTVKYSPDNGATWSILAQNVADVKYLWSVPKPLKNRKNNLLKVVGYTKTGIKVCSAISAPFIIEVVKLTDPNSAPTATIFTSGDPLNMTWTTNETRRPVAKVILEYTKNSGQTWIVIDRLTGDRLTEFNGSYPWTVPDVKKPKEKCKVRVRLKDSAGSEIGRDASDNYFTINPKPKS